MAGALFLFVDSSVRMLQFGTDAGVVNGLMTPAGKEVVSLDD
ncbi:MAG TPA: hypothetical protein VG013_29680 [Gemmataceae bacterium]|jgi:hypothetical protein|nr:hypothetical protein [Gemmataceae bacterium]